MPTRHRRTRPPGRADVRHAAAYEPDTHDPLGDRLRAPLPPELPPRIHHLPTVPPRRKCYRVIRHYYLEGVRGQQREDIGAFDLQVHALAVSNSEIGRAKVLAPNGEVIADNWHDIETRKAPTRQED